MVNDWQVIEVLPAFIGRDKIKSYNKQLSDQLHQYGELKVSFQK